jgi:hypothetical protein
VSFWRPDWPNVTFLEEDVALHIFPGLNETKFGSQNQTKRSKSISKATMKARTVKLREAHNGRRPIHLHPRPSSSLQYCASFPDLWITPSSSTSFRVFLISHKTLAPSLARYVSLARRRSPALKLPNLRYCSQ